jgi:hypothetical protein
VRAISIVVAMSLLAVTASVAGCTERQSVTGEGPLPVAATAYPADATRDVSVAKSPPLDVQELSIEIVNGQLGSDRYSIQIGEVRLRVVTHDGPFTLAIDGLLQARDLPPDTTTTIALNAPAPGDHTIRLDGVSQDTAILNVRPVGGR